MGGHTPSKLITVYCMYCSMVVGNGQVLALICYGPLRSLMPEGMETGSRTIR